MNRRKHKFAHPIAWDPNFLYEGPLRIIHIPATNQAVVEASTGGGKYEAAQSGNQ